MTHICVGKLTIIGSDNGLSPGRRQAITWTNVGMLLIGPLGTNFSEMLIEIHTFSFNKIHLKMSSGKWWPSCLGLNVLRQCLGSEQTSCPNYPVFITKATKLNCWCWRYLQRHVFDQAKWLQWFLSPICILITSTYHARIFQWIRTSIIELVLRTASLVLYDTLSQMPCVA